MTAPFHAGGRAEGTMKNDLGRVVLTFLRQRQALIVGWTTVILVVAVAYNLAQLTWLLVPQPRFDTAGMPDGDGFAGTAPPFRAAAREVDLAALHLFGTAKSTTKPPAERVEEAPDTRLRLVLRGVIAATEAEMARAIIAEPGGEEKDYAVGDSLPGGAILKEIAPTKVILQTRAGRLETLRLPKEASARGDRRKRWAASPERGRAGGVANRNRIVPRITPEELREYRNTMLNNPRELVGLIRTRPVRENGVIKGYKLFPGRDRALFNRLGLRPGDIIVSVNGMDLSDPASGLALLGELSSATQVEVVMERQGQRQTVTLSLE